MDGVYKKKWYFFSGSELIACLLGFKLAWQVGYFLSQHDLEAREEDEEEEKEEDDVPSLVSSAAVQFSSGTGKNRRPCDVHSFINV